MMNTNTDKSFEPEDVDISDHVAEAYMNQLGEPLYKKTVRQVDWVCEQAKYGTCVLDIGCSQGILEILVGRRGIRAVGVDISPEAVNYAEAMLAEEP